MENNVSTNVVKLNLKTIMENYRDPKFWSKKWTILDCKWLTAVWYIDNIDCKNRKIMTRVDVTTKPFTRGSETFNSQWDFNYCAKLSIDPRENSEEIFNNTVFNTMMRGIKCCEVACIYEHASYKDAMRYETEVKEEIRAAANKFLNVHNIEDEIIRDSYIEAFLKANNKNGEYTNKIIKQNINRVLTDAYIFAYTWFDRTDTNEYKELLKVLETKQDTNVLENIRKEVAELKAKGFEVTMKEGE